MLTCVGPVPAPASAAKIHCRISRRDYSRVNAKNRFFSGKQTKPPSAWDFPLCSKVFAQVPLAFQLPWILSRITSGRVFGLVCLELADRRKDPLSLSNPSDFGWGQTWGAQRREQRQRGQSPQSWKSAQLITTLDCTDTLVLYFPASARLRRVRGEQAFTVMWFRFEV